jgi:hypothetical protein
MEAMKRAEEFVKKYPELFTRHVPRELITTRLAILILEAERDEVKAGRKMIQGVKV